MKKTILLSVSLGVLGFTSPLLHEQIVGAETAQSSTQELPDKVTIHQQFQVRNIRGEKSILDKKATMNVYIDKSKSTKFAVPDNISHYHPVVAEVAVSSAGPVVNYLADDATVTVKYLDENANPIQKDLIFNQATIFGRYRLNKDEYNLPGYELLSSEAINGTIKDTNWDVTLKYRNLNPVIATDKLTTVVTPDQSKPDNKPAEIKQVGEPTQALPENPVDETTAVISKTPIVPTKPSPSKPGNAIDNTDLLVTVPKTASQGNTKEVQAPDINEKAVKTFNPDGKKDDKKRQVAVAPETGKDQKRQAVDNATTKLPDVESKIMPQTEAKKAPTALAQQTGTTEPAGKSEKSSGSPIKVDPTSSKSAENQVEAVKPVEKTQTSLETVKKPAETAVETSPKSADKSASSKETGKTSQTESIGIEKSGTPTKPTIQEASVAKESQKAVDHQEKLPTAKTYQLRGIDNHGRLLFNKSMQLTLEEAQAFRSKNIEFYGYDLQSTDLDFSSKVVTLHYLAKKVTFKIINADQAGRILSKDSVELEFGQTKTYNAKLIPGYQVKQSLKELKADNLMPEDVQFTYTKLADRSESKLDEKATVADKAEPKKQHQLLASSHKRSKNNEKNHEKVADTSDRSGKLPQTGDTKSVVGVLSGVALLAALIGQKLFKRLI
ncbi:MucBP domain-containing protein [Lentilactobacillus parakefiri]|uniref:MucBP domain-containing protein n=1 Tax=Lentilactobacillus parakefiri TaxID=152332 RepID=A0A224V2S4_9LACO|nr:MucBP domain-containing protein [Lentilactobacillus parakefiri]KRL58294.1 hypothetical protein FD08_GL003568 [Lentilactobacillus parakefiri DSM 10551]PAL00677.1 hypothetical protein B8W96_05290 [Lentilactobacillus parakefiri]TDG94121.1 hypothetical protein C5L28_001335 [Lentilactobacillus parakefiri]GAW71178.1 hypothetical protein LPKJCM_00250 [Lentilactobacillus parakefiri]